MSFLLLAILANLFFCCFSYGPDNVTQLSGYITVPGVKNDMGTHLFYWFFEARHSPATAPFIVWLTGGPGCSSMVALFYENGPYVIEKNLSLSLNPYSWNEVANVMWLDQPVGTGFSYADNFGDYVDDEKQVAEDLYDFFQAFFKKYPKYNKQFYIFGESYAGHYIPAFGNRIVVGNQHPRQSDIKIDFRGMAIGNGWVDPYHQYSAYADFLYEKHLLDAVSKEVYDLTLYPACEALLISGLWPVALEECSLAMELALADAEIQNGRTINVYDVTQRCEVEPLCYDFSLADQFFAQPSVLKALGVSPKATWTDCSGSVHMKLLDDWVGNFAIDIPLVLESNIPVLIYSGMNDFVCNYRGGEKWSNAMQWPGQTAFNAAQYSMWKVQEKPAGKVKTANNFTFLTVLGAGHMVPMNQPVNALSMVKTFISGQSFTKF